MINNLCIYYTGMGNNKRTYNGDSGSFVQMLFRYMKYIVVGGVTVAVLLLGFLIWLQTKSNVTSLINADIEVLKSTFFGDKPFVYYCHERGRLDYIPKKLLDAHTMSGNRHGLAILNCSQELPSGKDIWTRFKLKKDWSPSIFMTAPWAKPAQIPPRSLKETKSIVEFIKYSLQPEPIKVSSDKEFKEVCAFSAEKAVENQSPMCIVVSKGARYADGQNAMVTTMVETFHKNRILLVDAKVRRFAHERSDVSSNPDTYAMRLTAVRNGTHYLTMPDAPTWTNIQAFVKNAVKSPLDGFKRAESGEVSLVKPSQSSSSPLRDSSAKRNMKEKVKATRRAEKKTLPGDHVDSKAAESIDSKGTAGVEEAAAAVREKEREGEVERLRRERARREAMDRESREFLFEYDDDDDDDNNDNDEVEGDVEDKEGGVGGQCGVGEGGGDGSSSCVNEKGQQDQGGEDNYEEEGVDGEEQDEVIEL